jgi:hypothetical protein
MNEHILSGLIGAVIGYLVSISFDSIKNRFNSFLRQRKISKQIGILGELDFKNDAGYLALEHAIPMYKEQNISLKDSGTDFFLEIPKQYQQELKSFNFEIREASFKQMEDKVKIAFDSINIPNYQAVIQEESLIVAKDFLTELKKGALRFNGKLFGIDFIRAERTNDSEEPGLSINFYQTDYFTFRVFASLYKKYSHKFKITNIQSLNILSPFLSSFGLGNFVIINDGKQDFVLLGHRSNNVIVDRNKLHFSMNEAFSLMDIDEFNNPSFRSCLFRGLKEELGIDERFRQNIEYGFLDLGMDINRLEMGISSYARIQFDAHLTPDLLKNLYLIAQDGELETDKLELVPMKKLDTFINENSENMSAGCRATLRSLLIRYKIGYL